jgi:hypothetical protein
VDPFVLTRPVSVTIAAPLFERLQRHLFPGDGDEHGAVLAVGCAVGASDTRLLVRDAFLANDGVDYVPGERGYRALTARFVADASDACASQGLGYLAVHCHGAGDAVGFSADDVASHERGYPALLDIMQGRPVGALVFATHAVAGDIWTEGGRASLDHLTVIGPRVRRLYPAPRARPPQVAPVYDRHARLFGDVGQAILFGLKVGIIGLGGGGSLLNEWLARLGVGHIVAVDPDRVEITNLPRIVGATRRDALAVLAERRCAWLRRLGKRLARPKVDVARRVARQARPAIRYDTVFGSVLDEPTARRLTDVNFLFFASDTIQSRLVFNALVHQYLIPGAQIGVKVSVDRSTRRVNDVFAASRLVLPYPGGGCLECQGLIPAGRLQTEALSEGERRAQRYVDDEELAEPSVITLNALSAGPAANDLMMMFTGLYGEETATPHLLHFSRERTWSEVGPAVRGTCPDCGGAPHSRRARGDGMRLPCRMPPGNGPSWKLRRHGSVR